MPKSFPVLTILGLMSGTSMDGIDACVAEIEFNETDNTIALEKASIIQSHSIEYPKPVHHKLMTLVNQPEQCALSTICELNFEIADCFSDAANQLLSQLAPSVKVDAIASHGQTIMHIPPGNNNSLIPSTLQLGDISVIAQKTGIKTVGNFRTADMAVGGHGAPLVPFADQLLFQDNLIHRAIHNLGGISNTTVLPSKTSGNAVIAFDTGPANCLINLLCEYYYQVHYDHNGDIAKSGNVNQNLLNELLAVDYLKITPPKSTGRELFGPDFIEKYFMNENYMELGPADKIATATAFTVQSIRMAYEELVLPSVKISEVIFGGGGTRNNYLMAQLQATLLPLKITVKTHADFSIPDQYKEALAFALLGYANLTNVPANIPSCTGASRPVLLGQVANI